MSDLSGRRYAQVIRETMRVNFIGGIEDGLYPFDLKRAFTVDITDRLGVRVGMKYTPSLDAFEDDGKGFSLPEKEPSPTVDELTEALMDFEYNYYLKELIS